MKQSSHTHYTLEDIEAAGHRAAELVAAREAYAKAWRAFRSGPLGYGSSPEIEARIVGEILREVDPSPGDPQK